MWITGGRNFRANDLKTTEWIGAGKERGRNIAGPDLPKAMNSQCMVSYKNIVLIIGGNTHGRKGTNSVLVYKFRDLYDFRYLVYNMAIRVVKFLNGGYKIRKIFAFKGNY